MRTKALRMICECDEIQRRLEFCHNATGEFHSFTACKTIGAVGAQAITTCVCIG